MTHFALVLTTRPTVLVSRTKAINELKSLRASARLFTCQATGSRRTPARPDQAHRRASSHGLDLHSIATRIRFSGGRPTKSTQRWSPSSQRTLHAPRYLPSQR